MTDVPAVVVLTSPVVEPIAAIPVAPLLQVPAEVESVNVLVDPAQAKRTPEIVAGNGLTVTTAVTKLLDTSV